MIKSRINRQLLLSLIAFLAFAADQAKASLVAEYNMDFATSGPAEAAEILDSSGGTPSDAVQKICFPFWTDKTDTGVPVPNQKTGKAPSDGMAVGMTLNNGHEFGNGAKGRLTFDQGEFSIFARIFARPDGDFRIERHGTFEFRLFTDVNSPNKSRLMVGTVVGTDGKDYTVAIGDPGAPNTWHDYVMVFKPGDSVQLYVDGDLKVSKPTTFMKLNHTENPFRYMNYLAPQQFIESMRVYDNALTPADIHALSVH